MPSLPCLLSAPIPGCPWRLLCREILDMAAAATPPAAIASLPRLRSARFRPYEVRHLPPTALPMGPWAGRLQHLGASYGTLLLSGELLAAAGQLRELTIHGDGSLAQPSAASERFWWWCAVHPPLQKLRIEAREYTQFAAIVLKAILQLQRAWPARQADIELRY